MKRLLRALLSLIIIGGIGVALWPVGQIAYARWNQNATARRVAKSRTRNSVQSSAQRVQQGDHTSPHRCPHQD
jgi:hypothetical protein